METKMNPLETHDAAMFEQEFYEQIACRFDDNKSCSVGKCTAKCSINPNYKTNALKW